MSFFLVFVALVFSCLSPAQASVIKIESEHPALKKFEMDVNDLLPDHFKEIIKKPVKIQFKNIDGISSLENPCQGKRILGRTKFAFLTGKPIITLHSGFIPYIKNRDLLSHQFECGHKNFYKLALATLIHEITHVYDRSENHWSKSDWAAYDNCKALYEVDAMSNVDFTCQYYLKSVGKLSESPSYMNLIQFPSQHQKNKNILLRRSVDPYELVSAQEHFAVNMEHFLLDPEYVCRRPSLYEYFSHTTGHHPQRVAACDSVNYVIGTATHKIMPMDPARAYAVHYLFASEGEKMMSRWGHAMIRVIMCAPHRQQVGPECMNDVSHHIVFSYRANVNDIVLSYWGGIVGKYQSQLFAYSINEVVEEYNKTENRDLISLPLKLSEYEKNLLVGRLLEQFWSYSGTYYFLTNNCAHETDQIIKGALDRNHPYQDTASMSPLGIYQWGEIHGLTDVSVMQNREEALRSGYLFQGYAPVLEEAFAGIKGYGPFTNLNSYIGSSKALQRRGYLQKIPDRKYAAHLYLLEKHILRDLENRLDESILKMVLKQEKKKIKSELSDRVRKMTNVKIHFLPWNLAEGGYGIPKTSEMKPEEERQAELQKYRDIAIKVREEAFSRFPQIATEIENSRQNLKEFFLYIRQPGFQDPNTQP